MRFLADMGVDVRVVESLRAQGHDATHLRDEGLQRAPDDQVFEKAIAETRIILTFDLDFADLIALARGRSPSIILFRLGNPRLAQVKDRLAYLRRCAQPRSGRRGGALSPPDKTPADRERSPRVRGVPLAEPSTCCEFEGASTKLGRREGTLVALAMA